MLKSLSTRNKIASLLVLISFGLLYPGITKPIFGLKFSGSLNSQIASFETTILQSERSILGTVADLFERDRLLVAGLIFFFSVVIPILKNILLMVALWSRKWDVQLRIHSLLSAIGKWSMADVFVVAVFLAWMSTDQQSDATTQTLNLMGMKIPIGISTEAQSHLGEGFYYFLGYCLLSLATLHVASLSKSEPSDQNGNGTNLMA